MSIFHESVLYKEVLEGLNVKPGEIYVDATLGGGGHAKGILDLGGKVIGIDTDLDAINFVKKTIKSKDLSLEEGNFAELDAVLKRHNISKVSGVLFDLGASSYQLSKEERGFSFRASAHLDMRMNPEQTVTAADLVNGLNEGELYELFTKYGEERNARRIARAVVRSRLKERIKTTLQLASIIEASVGRSKQKIHPATRVFLALRVAVNDELNNLKKVLPKAERLLKHKGRLAVISFHSLEDRIVKNFIKESKQLLEVNEKPIVPTREELEKNIRARSAKLRIAEKIGNPAHESFKEKYRRKKEEICF